MTVTSLWKALDRAGCGKAVAAEDLVDHHGVKNTTNPWNFNQCSQVQAPTLAVDLSIWICESMTSSAIAENHADPTLHLVFTRTIKLLNIGVKLVGVLDGKRRIRNETNMNEFEKRRTGTPFWRACERCEELYNLLGVPIVRAKKEGEALCALLNLKGVVDGIISNDGDCFLFGARTLFTKFSIENLRQGRVMRYDADYLSACLDDDDSDAVLTALGEKGGSDALADVVNLTRSDLIAFAILTGSDVVGGGFPKVGCRKALRFIRKCQIDNPVRSKTASHDEMMSWASSSKYPLPTLDCPDTNKKCSVCFHVGTKSSHLTHGCLICETKAGEKCLQGSGGDKFRKSLRNKALSLVPAFDPKSIFDIYQSPNDNQIPLPFIGMGSKDVAMTSPNLDGLLRSTFIIRGKSYAESRKYILDSLSRLMAKVEISSQLASGGTQIDCNSSTTKCLPKENKPVPIKLLKTALRCSTACYEVLWKIPLSARRSDENRLDEFEFVTIEEQATVKKRYPDLVSTFVSNEKERHNQGRTEQERRRAFVDAIANQAAVGGNGDAVHSTQLVDKPNKPQKSHTDFFAKNKFIPTSASGDASNPVKASVPSRCRSQTYRGMGDDVAKLLEASGANVLHCPNAIDNDSIQSALSNLSTDNIGLNSTARVPLVTAYESPYKFRLTPSHVHFLRASGSRTQRHGSDNEYLGTDVQKVVSGTLASGGIEDVARATCPTRYWCDGSDDVTYLLPIGYESLLPARQRYPLVHQTMGAGDLPSVRRPAWYQAATIARIDHSPYLKRTKQSFGIGGTPPLSRNHPLLLGHLGGSPPYCLDLKIRSSHDDHEGIKQATIGGQVHDAVDYWTQYESRTSYHDEQENPPMSTFISKFCQHRNSRQPAYLPDPDITLLGSFAGISLHTADFSMNTIPTIHLSGLGAHSRRSNPKETVTVKHSWDEIDLDWGAYNTAHVRESNASSFRPTRLFADSWLGTEVQGANHALRRPLLEIPRDYGGLVNAAMASLQHKTRAAEMHEQNDNVLREALWQEQSGLLG